MSALALAGSLIEAAEPHADGAFVSRVFAAVSDQVHTYEATRRITAATRSGTSGWLQVWTAFDPERGFRFEILAEGGHGYIRKHVLRAALTRERDLHVRRRLVRGALTVDNYELGAPEWRPDGLRRLPLVPRRRDELLMRGEVVVTPDGDIVEVAGRLLQNPSMWTRRVEVRRRFERLEGVRVLRELSSTAHVLVVGEASFSMCYAYQAINGAPVVDGSRCS